jgi:hypothetical protein
VDCTQWVVGSVPTGGSKLSPPGSVLYPFGWLHSSTTCGFILHQPSRYFLHSRWCVHTSLIPPVGKFRTPNLVTDRTHPLVQSPSAWVQSKRTSMGKVPIPRCVHCPPHSDTIPNLSLQSPPLQATLTTVLTPRVVQYASPRWVHFPLSRWYKPLRSC